MSERGEPRSDYADRHFAPSIRALLHQRSLRSLDTLIARQGGKHVLYGSALTLAAAAQRWASHSDTPVRDLTRAAVR